MENKNQNARYLHEHYPSQSIRYAELWKEVRFQVAIGPRNGSIIGMNPETPGVKP